MAGDTCLLGGSEWKPLWWPPADWARAPGSGEAGTMLARSSGASGRSGKRGRRACGGAAGAVAQRRERRRPPPGLPGTFHTLYSLKTSSRWPSSMLPRQKHICSRAEVIIIIIITIMSPGTSGRRPSLTCSGGRGSPRCGTRSTAPGGTRTRQP